VIVARILAVLAAVNLVAAFALATLLPPETTLAQTIADLEPDLLYALHALVVAHLSTWVWGHLFMPVLLRPCWFLPTSVGLVCVGGAMTLGSRKSVPRSHRRRS
jgi:hypothetical protein